VVSKWHTKPCALPKKPALDSTCDFKGCLTGSIHVPELRLEAHRALVSSTMPRLQSTSLSLVIGGVRYLVPLTFLIFLTSVCLHFASESRVPHRLSYHHFANHTILSFSIFVFLALSSPCSLFVTAERRSNSHQTTTSAGHFQRNNGTMYSSLSGLNTEH
jgi:hypothetical protein